MSGWKKYPVYAIGYLSFFVAFFLVSLYLTFDANALGPVIEKNLAGLPALKGKDVTITKVSLYRVLGLEFRGVQISERIKPGEEAAPPLSIDRLSVTPRLSSLPGLFSALSKGKPPTIALSHFAVLMGGGKVEGELTSSPTELLLEAKIKNPIDLEKIALPLGKFKGAKFKGKLSGQTDLDLRDLAKPATWNGIIELELAKPEIKSLLILDDLSMERCTTRLKIEANTVKIETFKLQGEMLPVNLQGSLILKSPFRTSLLDVKGSVVQSELFKTKNPMASGLLPNLKDFSQKGPIEQLAPGVF